jgi:hypothetical protein
MDNGDWAEPQPMAITSLRLPADVIDQLKQQARTRHMRYTTYVRSILEHAARGGSPPELAEITERLDRIERALSGGLRHDDQKTALRTSVRAGPARAGREGRSQASAKRDSGGPTSSARTPPAKRLGGELFGQRTRLSTCLTVHDDQLERFAEHRAEEADHGVRVLQGGDPGQGTLAGLPGEALRLPLTR